LRGLSLRIIEVELVKVVGEGRLDLLLGHHVLLLLLLGGHELGIGIKHLFLHILLKLVEEEHLLHVLLEEKGVHVLVRLEEVVLEEV